MQILPDEEAFRELDRLPVDEVIKSYNEYSEQLYSLQQAVALYKQYFLYRLGDDPQEKVHHLHGDRFVLKITPKKNVSYPRPRGAQHPLEKLLQENPHLEQMVRISYDEKGKTIQKFLDDVRQGKITDQNLVDLAKKIEDAREVKWGTPTVSVELNERTDE